MFIWMPVVYIPDNKAHGANMRPIWGRQDPGGPHVGPMNFAIWDIAPEIRQYIYNILMYVFQAHHWRITRCLSLY